MTKVIYPKYVGLAHHLKNHLIESHQQTEELKICQYIYESIGQKSNIHASSVLCGVGGDELVQTDKLIQRPANTLHLGLE